MLTQKCRRTLRKAGTTAALVILVFTFGNLMKAYLFGTNSYSGSDGHVGRHLLSAAWESCDFELNNGHYVFILPYVFVTFLCFIGLALICDDFFVPSLEAISERLNLSEDVAGATFMAAGSSAPELFTAVAGVGVESDVGIGTIVGSAMFNILIIVALCAVLSGRTLYLDWRPLFRDSAMYGLSIILFIGFSWDGKLEWYEALVLLVVYILYIVLMKFNQRLIKLMLKLECAFCRNTRVAAAQNIEETNTESAAEHGSITDSKSKDIHHSNHSLHKHRFVHSHKGELAASISHRRRSTIESLKSHTEHRDNDIPIVKISSESTASVLHEFDENELSNISTVATITQQEVNEETQQVQSNSQIEIVKSPVQSIADVDGEDPTITLIPCFPAIKAAPPDFQEARKGKAVGWLKYILSMILFVLSFPFLVIFTWTIPNCSTNRKWYVITGSFLMSIFWIATLSFVMVTCVTKMGCLLDIGQFTMGLVVIAIGTSIPDALSSILVARDGFGDMAVSNAIGSNVFDINLGIGLPFLIRICIDKGKAFSLLTAEQWVDYNDNEYALLPHPKFSFLLLLILIIALLVFTAFRYRLSSFVGLCFVSVYLLFLTYAFIQDTVCDDGKHC